VRYRLQRSAEARDRRRERATALDGWGDRVTEVLERFGDARMTPESYACCEVRQVFDVLVREYGFGGSYQAVRRYLRRRFGPRPVKPVRRVELPRGVQAQRDWFEQPVAVAGSG
jgi:hypothetical protein